MGLVLTIRPGGTITRSRALALVALLAACASPAESAPSESGTSAAAPTPTATAGPAWVCDSLLEPREPRPSPGATPRVGFITRDQGALHAESASTTLYYQQCPPASGIHFGFPLPLVPGFYGPESEGHPGQWVHNLEHGYVVVLYSCADACPSAAELHALRRFVEETETEGGGACGVPGKLVATRFDQMATRFALLAWNRAHLSDTFDADDARAFAEEYAGDPFVAPEPDAC